MLKRTKSHLHFSPPSTLEKSALSPKHGNYKIMGINALFPLVLSFFLALATALQATSFVNAADWPVFLHDFAHTGNQNAETGISITKADQMKNLWSVKTKGAIAASPIVVGTSVYVGSWDGYMYAFNRDTGVQKWKTYLGKTHNLDKTCIPQKLGITATAQLDTGVLYVPGGDRNFYALNPVTGAVLWKTPIYTSTVPGDYYNWASTVIIPINGTPYAFIGLASLCDDPLVPGQLLQINLKTHAISKTFTVNFDHNNKPQTGGGIWTTPAIDTTTNPPTIYVTTGTPNGNQTHSRAVLAINALTMTLLGDWHVPNGDIANTPDPDFGSSPTLFSSSTGTPLVVAGHKNGYLYAVNRSTLIANGPDPVNPVNALAWKTQIAIGGESPQGGDGVLSTPVFVVNPYNNTKTLYAAGGKNPSTHSGGEVRAINPDTGAVIWTHDTSGTVIASMAYTNGVLIDASTTYTSGTLELLNASNGTVLKSFTLPGGVYSAPVISHGMVFVGANNGSLNAFAVPVKFPLNATSSNPS